MNLLQDGFEWFPSGANSSDRTRLLAANDLFPYGGFTVPDVVQGRFSYGNALAFNFNSGTSLTSLNGYVAPIGALPATGFIGSACFVYPDMHANNAQALCFFDAVSNKCQISVLFAANGVVKAYRGDPLNGTFLQASLAGSYQENEWFHAELKGVVAGTGGSIEVRVNTVPVLQIASANTQFTGNAYFDSILFGVNAPVNFQEAHCAFDDLFVNDTTGSKNNTWRGNCRVKSQFMIANGATNNFTIGGSAPAATHWQSVLNQLLDDTKYEYDSTVGDIDLFTPDPNLNSPLVHALQVRMGLRQDDATQRVARALLRIGGTNYLGLVDQFTNQTFTFYKERFETNPATGVDFTGADVNGLQAGLKLTA